MSGIDKGFLFGILTEVLRGNKRQTFSKLVCLTERRIWIYRDAVKSESCGVVHTVQLNYDLGGEIE